MPARGEKTLFPHFPAAYSSRAGRVFPLLEMRFMETHSVAPAKAGACMLRILPDMAGSAGLRSQSTSVGNSATGPGLARFRQPIFHHNETISISIETPYDGNCGDSDGYA